MVSRILMLIALSALAAGTFGCATSALVDASNEVRPASQPLGYQLRTGPQGGDVLFYYLANLERPARGLAQPVAWLSGIPVPLRYQPWQLGKGHYALNLPARWWTLPARPLVGSGRLWVLAQPLRLEPVPVRHAPRKLYKFVETEAPLELERGMYAVQTFFDGARFVDALYGHDQANGRWCLLGFVPRDCGAKRRWMLAMLPLTVAVDAVVVAAAIVLVANSNGGSLHVGGGGSSSSSSENRVPAAARSLTDHDDARLRQQFERARRQW
jgi:hypothetical protein